MVKIAFQKLVSLQKFFNIQKLYANQKYQPNPLINNYLEIQISNPVVGLLFDSFQRYGYVKVASSSKTNTKELTDILDYLKNKHINFQMIPKSLISCNTYEDIVQLLSNKYTNDIGAEYLHLNSIIEKTWFSDRFFNLDTYYNIDSNMKVNYLKLMNRSEQFDIFLGKKFQSIKRYSGEGAESILVCLLEIFKTACNFKISNIVISMAHRSRNNVLTTLLNYPPVLFFRKMLGLSEFPSDFKFPTGDTFSHYFHSTEFYHNEKTVNISLIPNPSHLEANIPVGAGKVRSKIQSHSEGDYSDSVKSKNGDNALGIFVHGDASVYGQGVVSETLVMTDSANFSIGGSIHIVINNKLGFTTETPNGIKNVTDIGKIINCPVIHVDAYSVSSVAKAAILAMEYRDTFRKDIFINLICYRRWGHNELDDPTITQPVMYSKIASSPSITESFKNTLLNENNIISEEITSDIENWNNKLNKELTEAYDYEPDLLTFKKQWRNQNILDASVQSIAIYNTGFDVDKLKRIGQYSVYIPPDFKVHQNVLKTHIQRRLNKLNSNESGNIDWATAEALALGSLLSEGTNCRLSGQDVGRGTFNHRHLQLVNQETNEHCISFNVCPWDDNFLNRGYLEIANSILSEEAVLGFEIGMAMDNPDNLFIWEAQFGDFFNGAQILIDTYLGSAETKWMLQNGLVLLLPHGYDGAGPEHSSCRIERFLQLTDSSETKCDSDSVNMHIINPTTPAQYFHALRRQIMRPYRRPLILVAPKMLLRSPLAVSNFSDIENGTTFRNILLDECETSYDTIETVLLCSGKHYYTLKEYLESSISSENKNKFSIIRIEQLTPFPIIELHDEIRKFKNTTRFVWSQEEPRNMGPWQFVNSRIRNILGINLEYSGRKELPTPAVGITNVHKREIIDVLKSSFES